MILFFRKFEKSPANWSFTLDKNGNQVNKDFFTNKKNHIMPDQEIIVGAQDATPSQAGAGVKISGTDNTVFIQKLSNRMPTGKIVAGQKSERDCYETFQPAADLELEDADGQPVGDRNVRFLRFNDFGKGLENTSPILRQQKENAQVQADIARKIRENRRVQSQIATAQRQQLKTELLAFQQMLTAAATAGKI